jgi:hypothetical protein
MSEAIDRFVPDGSSVVMGAALESLIPFAAGTKSFDKKKRADDYRTYLRHIIRSVDRRWMCEKDYCRLGWQRKRRSGLQLSPRM